jgi:hypothetical protein
MPHGLFLKQNDFKKRIEQSQFGTFSKKKRKKSDRLRDEYFYTNIIHTVFTFALSGSDTQSCNLLLLCYVVYKPNLF